MTSRRQLLFGAFLPPDRAAPPGAAAEPLAGEEKDSTGPRVVAFAEHCLAFQNVVCRSCGERCEEDAIRFSPRLGAAAHPLLDPERCTGCGDCVAVCPNAALTLVCAPASTISTIRSAEEFAE